MVKTVEFCDLRQFSCISTKHLSPAPVDVTFFQNFWYQFEKKSGEQIRITQTVNNDTNKTSIGQNDLKKRNTHQMNFE